MSWFTVLYFAPMLLLGLWLFVGIYLALRESVALGHARVTARKRAARPSAADALQPDAWYNMTPLQVQEAFELFLRKLETKAIIEK